MNIRKTTAAAAVLTAAMAFADATPVVDGVTMSQAGSRLVTIAYTLENAPAVVTLDIQTNRTGAATSSEADWVSIGGEAVSSAQGAVWRKVTAADGVAVSGEEGVYRFTITWRADLSWPGHNIKNGGARAVVTAWALDNTPDYMVVDVSAAAESNTQTYYPAADFVPGGVTNGLYKTTSLLMRKIMSKDLKWTMGSATTETGRTATREATHSASITNNYYIGVYEVTQSQWGLVATNSGIAAYYTASPTMRPMEKVSYNDIRNTHNTATSGSSTTAGTITALPSSDSFLGLLNLKTGLDFDLPSEAQWEFAARAGNASGYWGDGSEITDATTDPNLSRMARYSATRTDTSTTTKTLEPSEGGTDIVGSYEPNSWGLYDMYGNVEEWCLDWYQDNIATAKDASDVLYGGRVNIDPDNPLDYLSGATVSDGKRTVRGGNYNSNASACRPAQRKGVVASDRSAGGYYGFRLVCTAGLE